MEDLSQAIGGPKRHAETREYEGLHYPEQNPTLFNRMTKINVDKAAFHTGNFKAAKNDWSTLTRHLVGATEQLVQCWTCRSVSEQTDFAALKPPRLDIIAMQHYNNPSKTVYATPGRFFGGASGEAAVSKVAVESKGKGPQRVQRKGKRGRQEKQFTAASL